MSVSHSEATEPGIALDLGSSMVVVSRSGTEYPRPPPLCTEALQGRELVWSMLPNNSGATKYDAEVGSPHLFDLSLGSRFEALQEKPSGKCTTASYIAPTY